MIDPEATERSRRLYDAYAPRYDREVGFYERVLLGDGRTWACAQATGEVLEVAVGTGRNLPFYPHGVQLTGVDLSPAMLAIAQARARHRGIVARLQAGDAQALSFADGSFDTALCTLGLSSIPDPEAAIREMSRVLRPGGRMVLVGHVASHHRAARAGQALLERLSVPLTGDYQTREPLPLVLAAGFLIDHRERRRAGIIERLVAVKPGR
ncbi:MAG: class I SAM-dependent methyltransferase [Streptosporangiales bacterium]